MDTLDENSEHADENLVLSAVQYDNVSSSNDACSSDCTAKSANEKEEILLDDLANLLLDIYLGKVKYGKRNS